MQLESKVASLEKRLAKYEASEKENVPVAKLKANVHHDETVDAGKGSISSATHETMKEKGLFGLGSRRQEILSFGAYGELKFGGQEESGDWQNGFDAQRIVLLPTLQITDSIIFNAELEFEHGGIAEDDDDKLTGAIEVEQAYIDFKFNDYFNWRAPGVDVVPFGFINLFHEPTQFYSVNRPELYQGLIPSTWFEGSTSVYGKIVNNLNYQFQINTGLEDVGSKNGVPHDGSPYEGGITATEALALARTPIGDFHQTKNAPGFAFRLGVHAAVCHAGLSGLQGIFFRRTPRDARRPHGRRLSLGHSNLTMLDTEVRYRVPKTGFEFRGEVVDVIIGTPSNLRANNDGDPEDNVGKNLWGFSLEAAYHVDLSASIHFC